MDFEYFLTGSTIIISFLLLIWLFLFTEKILIFQRYSNRAEGLLYIALFFSIILLYRTILEVII